MLETLFNALIGELRRADAFYDSGIFRLLDDERLGVRISDQTLQGIISEPLLSAKSVYLLGSGDRGIGPDLRTILRGGD